MLRLILNLTLFANEFNIINTNTAYAYPVQSHIVWPKSWNQLLYTRYLIFYNYIWMLVIIFYSWNIILLSK